MFAKLGIPLFEVLHRVVEPFMLMHSVGTNDPTRHDMLKQLVARLVKGRRTGGTAFFGLRLGHEPGWRKKDPTNVTRTRRRSQTHDCAFANARSHLAQTVPPAPRAPMKSRSKLLNISGDSSGTSRPDAGRRTSLHP